MNEEVAKSRVIPTIWECYEICEKNPKFYFKKHIVDGYEVVLFDYFLAGYNDFVEPFEGCCVNGMELRGLAFVNYNGSWKSFPALRKFFQVNQVPETQLETIKNLQMKRFFEKLDGSMITFIKLPNGIIVPKTKMGFDNPQVALTKEILSREPETVSFISACMNHDVVPIFELVSPKNMIVLPYSTDRLMLIQMRERESGKHMSFWKGSRQFKNNYPEIFKSWIGYSRINIGAEPYNIPSIFNNVQYGNYQAAGNNRMEMLYDYTKQCTGREGFVVILYEEDNSDVLFVKVKSDWYMQQHSLITNNVCKEDTVIQLVLSEKYDEVTANLTSLGRGDIVKGLRWIQNVIINHAKQRTESIIDAIKDVGRLPEKGTNQYMIARKIAFTKYKDHRDRKIIMSMLGELDSTGEVIKHVIDSIRKDTYKFTDAKNFLKDLELDIWQHIPCGFREVGNVL